MRLENDFQLNNTREKLKMLQEQYAETNARECANEYVRELTLISLGRLIKQLKEEIIWYECHAHSREPGGATVVPIPNTPGTSSTCTN